MSYRLSYSENFHYSNFQHPASEAAKMCNIVISMPRPFRIPKLFWNGPNFGLKQNVLDMGQNAKVYFVVQFFDQSKMF